MAMENSGVMENPPWKELWSAIEMLDFHLSWWIFLGIWMIHPENPPWKELWSSGGFWGVHQKLWFLLSDHEKIGELGRWGLKRKAFWFNSWQTTSNVVCHFDTLGPNTLWQSNVPMENSPLIVYRWFSPSKHHWLRICNSHVWLQEGMWLILKRTWEMNIKHMRCNVRG